MKDTKFGGRPAIRKPKQGQRVHLSLAVPQELKWKIEKAAHHRGWSISVEASHRLERSFEAEALLPQMLELKYGPKLAGLLLALARAMQDAGKIAGFHIPTVESPHDWFDVPEAYDQAVLAASRVLEAGRLEVDAPTAKKMHMIIGAKKIPFFVIAAHRVFDSIKGRSTSESAMVEGGQISKLLGSSASRFKGEKK
jgi:hypothetical protein